MLLVVLEVVVVVGLEVVVVIVFVENVHVELEECVDFELLHPW